tara:strand:+ start:1018 stop:1281 length:264 start_codon:yes stop_codon:yes gene_type:complete
MTLMSAKFPEKQHGNAEREIARPVFYLCFSAVRREEKPRAKPLNAYVAHGLFKPIWHAMLTAVPTACSAPFPKENRYAFPAEFTGGA